MSPCLAAHPKHPPDPGGSEQSKLLIVVIHHHMAVIVYSQLCTQQTTHYTSVRTMEMHLDNF